MQPTKRANCVVPTVLVKVHWSSLSRAAGTAWPSEHPIYFGCLLHMILTCQICQSFFALSLEKEPCEASSSSQSNYYHLLSAKWNQSKLQCFLDDHVFDPGSTVNSDEWWEKLTCVLSLRKNNCIHRSQIHMTILRFRSHRGICKLDKCGR